MPAVPLMPTLVNAAIPATALMVLLPRVVAPLLTVIVTKAVLLVTVLPKASLMVITGWVVNAEPLALPAAEGVSVALVAVPKTVATWAALLIIPKDVIVAVRLPGDGAELKVIVNRVEVAEVTMPVPLLKITILLPGVALKPEPAMVKVVAVIERPLALKVMVGGAT